MSQNRVIVLGIDGATFDMLDRWLEQGTMPHLQRLLSAGVRADLRSTVPPYTPQAWVSMMTGKYPARHGVIDFVERGEDRVPRGYVSSTAIADESVWDTASRHQIGVGILNMPLTYPPRTVNGYMVSGLLTPKGRRDYAYPNELVDELEDLIPGYEPDPYEPLSLEKDVVNFLHWTEMTELAARHLYATRPASLFVSVIQTVDYLQHIVWRALADDSARLEPAYQRVWPTVERCLSAVDQAIGQRLEWMDEDTTLFLVSDHGFQAVRSWFHVNRWLAESGWLKLTPSSPSIVGRLMRVSGLTTRRLKAIVRRLDFLGLRRYLGQSARGQMAARVDDAMAVPIEWSETLAYAAPPTNEGIYINVSGREEHGLVARGEDYERVRSQILASLESLEDPWTKRKVVSAAHRREDLYSGTFLPMMPDILLSFDDRPYLTTDSTAPGPFVEPIPRGYVEGRHHSRGVFAAVGHGVRSNVRLPEARIVDVAPTLLYALDLPVPSDTDGQVLDQVFTSRYRDQHPIRYDEPGLASPKDRQRPNYDEDEEDDLRRRLRGLGYVT